MKNGIFIHILCLLQVCAGNSQNLVPNYSFEQYSTCPTNEAQIEYATDWYKTFGDADYYNACSTNPSWTVPPGPPYGQYQLAATGSAFAGLIVFIDSIGALEIIHITLLTPLIPGTKYFVSFRASLVLDELGETNLGVNKMGVKFTNGSIPSTDNSPQVFANSVITDTSGWTTVSGSFIADSAYSYIFIGIFFDEANVTSVKFLPTAPYPMSKDRAYYYIDDVCVSADSLTCNTPVTIKELPFLSSGLQISPNPTSDEAKFKYPLLNNLTNSDIIITNLHGEKVARYELDAGKNEFTIKTDGLENGIYFYLVIINGHPVAMNKMVIIR
ncbi:MAG: T9SS type A sorting domain-containing protein [Bacteroidetes bacterium]|nr:T9SS type A sorting domain-containing protein [Bacteroidota bacterium]